MSGLSDMQAKRLAAGLAKQVTDGSTDQEEFKQDLIKYHAYQQEQRAAGKKTRGGKHSAQLAPLLAALPKEQRALGLHVSAEHADTRGAVQAVANQVDALAREVQQNTQPRPGQLQMMVDPSAPSVSIPHLECYALESADCVQGLQSAEGKVSGGEAASTQTAKASGRGDESSS